MAECPECLCCGKRGPAAHPNRACSKCHEKYGIAPRENIDATVRCKMSTVFCAYVRWNDPGASEVPGADHFCANCNEYTRRRKDGGLFRVE